MYAKTPPMGWNSWNTFAENISEELLKEVADAMVEKGYKDAGYEYVVIDDCWAERQRDENGHLVVDKKKFPNGIKAVADYVHSKGLKFGIYSAAGVITCAGRPGSFGHEFEDAKMFADWGVDFLKYDICGYPGAGNPRISYLTMSQALRATGRDILFSGCTVGGHDPWLWMRSVGADMYRSTGDIFDKFESFKNNAISQFTQHHMCMSGAGCFNDPDMLIVGMHDKGYAAGYGGCSDLEYRTHFALWCFMGVPLMMGGDIRSLSKENEDLLLNKELIRLNQDPETRPPYYEEKMRYANDKVMAFTRLLSDGEIAIGLFNFNDKEERVRFILDDAGIPSSSGYGFEATNLFTGEKTVMQDFYMPIIQPHDCQIFRGKLVKLY